ncbi:hypothetical protein CsSME_00009146 [Camellia sinensis var. sinensis]
MGEQEYESLSNNEADEEQPEDVVPVANAKTRAQKTTRVASLDVFRGLCVFLMMLVDYGGSILPIIAHSPWNGVHLADFVMPFFLFIAGVSLALGYKRVSDRVDATQKALLRALKLFFLGVLLQVYLGLSYGLYVPDWQFELLSSTSMPPKNGSFVYTVTCSTRGDHGPACNAAGMIDRYILGLNHLYTKPVYRNLKECNISSSSQLSDNSPSWCHAAFDPEAAVTCIIGLQYGHILGQLQDHKERLYNWCIFSFSFLGIGLFLALVGIPLNKPLYTISYMLVTSASAGITFSALYILVDIHGHRHLTYALEWIGKHALSIFVLVSSNLAVIAIQGFYWNAPENNVVHWIVTRVRQS